jgi:NSS family neurotransmitter:Na+ symporter
MATNRDSWNTRLGFLLAAVGSAVGLGNLWRFAYIASEGGGAAFLILYLILIFLIGVPLLTAELAIGRHTGQSPIRALTRVGGRGWSWLGVVFVFGGFAILSYYSVIMGWTGRVLVDTVRGALPVATDEYFGRISTGPAAIAWHLGSMALTIAVVRGGIRRGIERTALILMPLLFVLVAGLAVWATTLSGGGPGYAYYLRPHIADLFTTSTLTRAAGQAFFSMSLGMGAIITYASYLKGQGNLPREAGTIALSDMSVALVGGLVTFPIIYHFGLAQSVSESNVGALFIAVPRAFAEMGGTGAVIGTVFFLSLYIAALTSAISLLEVVVSAFIDGPGWSRQKSALVAGVAIAVAGIPAALNTDWLGLVDKVVGNVLLIFGGLMTALLVGYAWSRGADEELAIGFGNAGLRRTWLWLLRILIPIVLAIVLYYSVLATVPAFQAVFGGG